MEADWVELATAQLHAPPSDQLPPQITTLAFDTCEENLWVGTNIGYINAYHGHGLTRYTAYRGHYQLVHQILFTDDGVLSVSDRSLHYSRRGGFAIWHLASDLFKNIRCMNFTSKGTRELLVAGCQTQMFLVDMSKGMITKMIRAQDEYTAMKRVGQYLCLATHHGNIHIVDSVTLDVLKVFECHTSYINDFDAKGDFLITCGHSPRPIQAAYVMMDPFINVLSLKTLTKLPPIPFHAGAAFVRMHPRMSTTSIIASPNGHIQIIDIMNSDSPQVRQINLFDAYIRQFEIAPSGEAIVLCDTNGHVHIWGSPTKVQFAEFANPSEFADPVPHLPDMDWSNDTPLSSIGMPYYSQPLLSAWPSDMVFEVGAPPPKIADDIQATMRRSQIGFYAPNPGKRLRNQAEDTRQDGKSITLITPPKFLSEKARASRSSGEGDETITETLHALTDIHLEELTTKNVPAMYGKLEIKYGKFGVNDFDFGYYNKTPYSGLETNIANSYANPLLQICRFVPLLRNLAMRHTACACPYDHCLLCELGFLIDMLEKAAGSSCHASNFLKAFSRTPSAVGLQLLEGQPAHIPMTNLIQNFSRFLFEQLTNDFRRQPSSSDGFSPMDQVLKTQYHSYMRCDTCHNETARDGHTFVTDLVYPPKPANVKGARPHFSQILKASVERRDQTKGWCNKCQRYREMINRRSIQKIPDVFVFNASVSTKEIRSLWSHNWLPHEIGIIVSEDGQFFCYQGKDLQLHLDRKAHNIVVYDLIGVVNQIDRGDLQTPHLVAAINTAPASSQVGAEDSWHLFNDFLVRPIPKEEALRFDQEWKQPSVLVFQRKAGRHQIDDSWRTMLDTSPLYHPTPLVSQPAVQRHPDGCIRLNPEVEAPQSGYPVAIDTEMVEHQKAEMDAKADGRAEIIRPRRLGLGRVSVCRGAGERAGVPFIDDYIAASEPIIDHLTPYSGIYPGDLDPTTSRFPLVAHKHAYKKLWLLLNLGCVFVGHGLVNDLRIINIFVPRNQIVDTAELFIKRSISDRLIGLRYLAWLILKEDVQSETHDSVEDARTSLKLWRKYQEFVDAGVLEQILNEIYNVGKPLNFKVPGSGGAENNSNEKAGSSPEVAQSVPVKKGVGLRFGRGFRGPKR
ncbi:PAB-dependent poly(A)-specific ribonuclease-like protein subunit pan2 [Westerdykella ornata]|uniref:PAN2-PAN3 deadenylation complex catalytic subunit PAN2 n=1 Tax=Westerdykella ornata TaxID=318751 RepID=A0A6A6JKH3_WESOR|nr:PAB-dependent poly(A)-specific ribonuclease-like protein subunit pan2 [Westerdykella ornata]KAF2277150.1 PAB-dependent poly(A)-specific ribonuclease-like protein subunit pan2 [Westerdykella ornata]